MKIKIKVGMFNFKKYVHFVWPRSLKYYIAYNMILSVWKWVFLISNLYSYSLFMNDLQWLSPLLFTYSFNFHTVPNFHIFFSNWFIEYLFVFSFALIHFSINRLHTWETQIKTQDNDNVSVPTFNDCYNTFKLRYWCK